MGQSYTIPAHYGFADALARGLLQNASPFDLAQTEIYLPTRRAVRTLQAAFMDAARGSSLILPRLHTVGDLDADEMALAGEETLGLSALHIPPAMGAAQQLFLLSRLVDAGWDGLLGSSRPKSTQVTLAYARTLMALLDTLETEGLDLSSLGKAAPQDPDLLTFWDQAARFIGLVQDQWPLIEGETGRISASRRRRLLLELKVQDWQASPPQHPIILAGTTATIPAVAGLAKAVAELPKGQIVLPGLDPHLDAAAWAQVGQSPSHPQHGLLALLNKLDQEPQTVALWPGCTPALDRNRHAALSAAQRPVGAASQVDGQVFDLSGLHLVEAKGPEQEARAIALFLREALEDPQATAALVTPDRDLAGRVAAELRRWNLEIDDSAGAPLAGTSIGRLVNQAVEVLGDQVPTLGLLSILNHALTTFDQEGGVARTFGHALDLSWRMVGSHMPAAHIGWIDSPMTEDLAGFFARASGHALPLADWIERHLDFLALLTGSPENLWTGAAGEELARVFEDMQAHGGLLPRLEHADYVFLVRQFVGQASVRARFGTHPRLSILGTLEARLLRVNAVALGGLNEGTWPKETDVGPWMNRPTRAEIGLPSPERKVGLAAHDLAQAFGADQVLMTRSTRQDGAPTLASRWIERLRALTEQTGQTHELLGRGPAYLAWADQLDQHTKKPVQAGAADLACPPASARPKSIWATDIELLVTNPYGFYAKRILNLRALDPRGQKPANLAWGLLVHGVLEGFVREGDRDLRSLLERGQRALEDEVLSADQRAIQQVQLDHCLRGFWRLNQPYLREASTVEETGSFQLGPMTVAGKADRLIRRQGLLHVVDYKTGGIATGPEQENGTAPQLPVLALIARAGGFDGPKPQEVSRAFFQLPRRAHEAAKASVEKDILQTVEAGLNALFTAYARGDQPYLVAPFGEDRGRAKFDYDDYAHLARRNLS